MFESNWKYVTTMGKGYHLGVCNFNETNGGDLLEFNDLHHVGGDLGLHGIPMLEWCCLWNFFCWSNPLSEND
jgi:hypothetical protein